MSQLFSSGNALLRPPGTEEATNSQEAEDIEKERKVETDDPESLRKAREFDEYKDGIYFDCFPLVSFHWLHNRRNYIELSYNEHPAITSKKFTKQPVQSH